MENTQNVIGIIPGEIMGIEKISTAEKQEQVIEKTRAEIRQARREQRMEKRQERQDNRIFDSIRQQLIEKVFELSDKQIEKLRSNRDKFENDLARENLNQNSDVFNDVNIANGALVTENSARRGLITTIGTASLGVLGINITSKLTAILAGTVLAPAASVIAPVAVGMASIIAAKYFYDKSRSANRSDTIEKEKAAIKAINELMEKIENFVREVEKDKEMLIEKKKSFKTRAEFDAFLNDYLKTKSDLISTFGLPEIVNNAKTAILSAKGRDGVDSKKSENTIQTQVMV